MSSSWFSCWPSSSPLTLSYCLHSFKVMVPLRNNHLYWFSPQHLFLSDELWTSYLILQTAAPVALYSVCHFMPHLSSLFLLFLLMHILCWPLHLRFSSNGTSQLNDQTVNQVTGWPWKGDPCPALCLCVLSTVSQAGYDTEEKQFNVISSGTLPWALCYCPFADTSLTFPFYTRTNHLEWIGLLIKI